MTLRKGLPAKLAATDANDTRYNFNNLVVCNADGSPRGGVTAPLTALVSSSATMNVSVAAFSAVAIRDGGVVLLDNDGPVNVLLTAAPAANSRIDVIYAKQNDASSTVTTPDANNNAVIDKVTGTAAPSPTKPALPVGAVELATVLVPSTATATNSSGVVINQTAQFTAGPGGVVPFPTFAAMQLWTNPRTGQVADVFADSTTAYNRSYRWNGTAWASIGPFAEEVQYASIGIGASGATWTLTVNFTAGKFTTVPAVQVWIASSPGVARKLTVASTGPTLTQVTLTVSTGDGTNPGAQTALIGWHAIQMTPTSATG